MMTGRARIALSAAARTALLLVGGLIAAIALGNLISSGLEGHAAAALRDTAAAIPAIAVMAIASGLWGASMGRLAGYRSRRRMVWAGILGFVPVTIGSSVLLLVIEPVALRLWGESIPIHRLYTLLFVPTAFLITTTMTFALCVGLEAGSAGRRLALRAGLAGAAAFLIIDALMEAAGWVVGAPGAVQRLTMLTVTFTGDLGAALAAGAVIGHELGRPDVAGPPAN
jgi:hypothetical protein